MTQGAQIMERKLEALAEFPELFEGEEEVTRVDELVSIPTDALAIAALERLENEAKGNKDGGNEE